MRIPVLALILLPACAWAITPRTEPAVTLRQMREAFAHPRREKTYTPFSVTGQVTHLVMPTGRQPGSLVLTDDTGRFEFFFGVTNSLLLVGDISALSGFITFLPNYQEPMAAIRKRVTLKRGTPLPPPPTVALGELENEKNELRVVKTEATVVDVVLDDLGSTYDFLLLKDGATVLPAFCLHNPGFRKLIDARVEVCGLVQRGISSERKFVGTCLSLDGPDGIRVLKPAPVNPFDYPALPHLFYISPKDVAGLGKHTVRGTVLAAWRGSRLLVRTEEDSLHGIELASGEQLPRYGDRITAAGYPTTDLFRMNLTRAHVRVDERGTLAEDAPDLLNLSGLSFTMGRGPHFLSRDLGVLVRVRGIVRTLPFPEKDDFQLLADCDGVKLPIDFSANPTAADGIALGATVEATGRFVPDLSSWAPTEIFPRVEGVTLVVCGADGIRVVARPPWWTPLRLMAVIALLLVVLLGFYVRTLYLKHLGRVKLGERTQLAVELHDSLSQSLTGLACQVASAEDSLDADPQASKDKLKTASRMLKSCREELRDCLFDLRNDTYDEEDFGRAIRRTVEPFDDSAEILVRFNVDRSKFDDATVHTVLAIVRELVSNAIRHGNAWTIRIAGALEDGALRFSVADDGSGFDPAQCKGPEEGHFGLDGIRERLARFDGTLTIERPKSGGTKAVVRIPLSRS